MTELVLDVETTFQKLPKGKSSNSPFDSRNKLVCVASYADNLGRCVPADSSSLPRIQQSVDDSSLVIGFNFKFDYHWLRHWGVSLAGKALWDCQLAEFIINNQVGAMPSLDECLEKYGLEKKYDIVKHEYWDKGINTDKVPWDILSQYAMQDVRQTYALYLKQRELLTGPKLKLFKLQMQDLHILEDMEWNGLKYNNKLCEERASELSQKIESITRELSSIYPDVPINFGSPEQLSAFLYGGIIKQEVKEHVGFFKTGKQAGQPKYRNAVIEHQLPRLYTPLKGSEMAKEGVYSTAEDTLKKLKGKRKTVDMLLELAKLSKLNETYYVGLPLLNQTMNWEPEMLHGQFNQCVAVTGRLSSSNPNLQNFASELQDVFVTRY